MSTPPLSDEEFDALFRRGLEHYPEQPDAPAAWLGMELLLDAEARRVRLRRKLLRLLGGEALVLGLLSWGLLSWVEQPLPPVGYAAATRLGPAHLARVTPDGGGAGPASAGRLLAQRAASAAGRPAAGPLATGADQPGGPVADHPVPASGRAPVSGTAAGEAAHPARHPAGLPASAPAVAVVSTRHPRRRVEAATQLLATDAARRPSRPSQAGGAGVGEHRRRNGLAHPGRPAAATLLTGARPSGTPPRPESPATASALAGGGGKIGVSGPGRFAAAGSLAGTSRPVATRSARPARLVTGPGPGPQEPVAAGIIAAASQDSPAVVAAVAQPAAVGLLDPRLGRLQVPGAILPDQLALLPVPASPPPLPLPPPPLANYRLRVGLLGAPELSAVSAEYLKGPGWSAGAYLDYRVAPRWHLSAGYLMTLKRYAAEGYAYHLPAGYPVYPKWVINDVDAVCRIADIPVNLRFDAWQRPGRQLFVSAGLSSLLMRDERYTYNYAPVNGYPVAPYSWELANGSQHWLKILNLSAGYERAVGQRWSVQAEPFVKLPLAGVGFGAVRLASAGVFFSLRYGLLPQPTRPTP